MKDLDITAVNKILNEIVEYEMAGVVRYAHSSLMVTGPFRTPIVGFLQEQANESLAHALQAGEFITGFDGHPSQKISQIQENNIAQHTTNFAGKLRTRAACNCTV